MPGWIRLLLKTFLNYHKHKVMKLKLKSKSSSEIWVKMSNKVFEGWKVTRPPYRNWLGVWVCKLEIKHPMLKTEN